MRPAETIATLARFERRGAGTDSERRAANWLAEQVETKTRTASIEPFWCRPNWALAHAWHASRRNPWHLRALTSHRPRPPYGRRRAKPSLETVEKLVTGLRYWWL